LEYLNWGCLGDLLWQCQFAENKKPKQHGRGYILEQFQKNRHILRKKIMKLSRFLEDLGKFLALFPLNSHTDDLLGSSG
jgi:hypothetical protein